MPFGFFAALLARLRPSPLANATVYLIRHAEKPDAGPSLTPAGERRAQAYVAYLQRDPIDGKPLAVTHVFAAQDSAKSVRPRLTAEPIARASGLVVDLRFRDKEPDALVRELRTRGHGDRILVVWRHGGIPRLVEALGGDPKSFLPKGKWPDLVYDRVDVLRFDRRGSLLPARSRTVVDRLSA